MAAVFVVAVAGAWLIVSIVVGFPAWWETIFQTVVSALTLAMLAAHVGNLESVTSATGRVDVGVN